MPAALEGGGRGRGGRAGRNKEGPAALADDAAVRGDHKVTAFVFGKLSFKQFRIHIVQEMNDQNHVIVGRLPDQLCRGKYAAVWVFLREDRRLAVFSEKIVGWYPDRLAFPGYGSLVNAAFGEILYRYDVGAEKFSIGCFPGYYMRGKDTGRRGKIIVEKLGDGMIQAIIVIDGLSRLILNHVIVKGLIGHKAVGIIFYTFQLLIDDLIIFLKDRQGVFRDHAGQRAAGSLIIYNSDRTA